MSVVTHIFGHGAECRIGAERERCLQARKMKFIIPIRSVNKSCALWLIAFRAIFRERTLFSPRFLVSDRENQSVIEIQPFFLLLT